MSRINVCDSIMGSGKTSAAIKFINDHKDQKIIYCTPFIKEISRIREECPHIKEPTEDNIAGTKGMDFINLLKRGESIAVTHELFKHLRITDSILKLITDSEYTLILDEMIDVVEKIKISSHDMKGIMQYCVVEEGTKKVYWTDDSYTGRYDIYKRFIKSKTVIQYKSNILLWLFPVSLIRAFTQVHILTFMFEGSCLERYLTINGFSYDMYYVQNGELKKGRQPLEVEKEHIRSLLHIYSGKLNDIGDNMNALCLKWWTRKANSDKRKKAFNNADNYIRNIDGSGRSTLIWTMFKLGRKSKANPSIKGRWAKRFCPCNARATNDWRECTTLVYLANIYPDVAVQSWFRDHHYEIDEDQYALSTQLQWIWRSAIREGKEVNLYIPSRRMREKLENWLEGDKFDKSTSDKPDFADAIA